MSWGYGYGRWMGWAPAMTVGARKAKVKRTIAEYRKEGKSISPVEIQGRTIARTFWGKAWCDNIESYRDYAYRLERGRSYVRSGAVIDLQIGEGAVTALVIGSGEKPYRVSVRIDPMRTADWKALVQRAAGRVSSLFALAQGQLPEELLQDFCNPETGLFPKPREIHFDCSCPDGASCCKHVAAVLYGIGARLDKKPELFFTLRGIDPDSIVSDEVVETLTEGASNELENADLSDVFGISLDADASAPRVQAPAPSHPQGPASQTRPQGLAQGQTLPRQGQARLRRPHQGSPHPPRPLPDGPCQAPRHLPSRRLPLGTRQSHPAPPHPRRPRPPRKILIPPSPPLPSAPHLPVSPRPPPAGGVAARWFSTPWKPLSGLLPHHGSQFSTPWKTTMQVLRPLGGRLGKGQIFFKRPLQDFLRNQHLLVLRHHDGTHRARHRVFHHDAVRLAAQDDADGRLT